MTIRYEEIEKALEILQLPEKATLKQIKSNYRKLIAKWHPDKCSENIANTKKCKEMTQQIIEAYKTIITYCNNYEYSFNQTDVQKVKTYEELWTEQFGNDPIWGFPKK